jgi:hypothetical protein
MAASSAESVSFCFIHTNHVPISGFPFAGKCSKDPLTIRSIALTIIDRLFSCELP